LLVPAHQSSSAWLLVFFHCASRCAPLYQQNRTKQSQLNSKGIQSAKSLIIFKTKFPHNHYGLKLWTTRPNDLPARNAVLKPIVKTSSNYIRKTVREFEASFLHAPARGNLREVKLNNHGVLAEWKECTGSVSLVKECKEPHTNSS